MKPAHDALSWAGFAIQGSPGRALERTCREPLTGTEYSLPSTGYSKWQYQRYPNHQSLLLIFTPAYHLQIGYSASTPAIQNA